MTMQVTLKQPVILEEVDSEIIVVAGCALGFVAPKQPPHVLHVDPDTEMASHSIRGDDLLVSVDGRDTRTMVHKEVAACLRIASQLTFERPKAPPEGAEEEEDEDTDAPSGDEEASSRPGPTAPAAAAPAAGGAAEEPVAQPGDTPHASAAAAAAAAARWRDRSRSRRRHRRREGRHGEGAPPGPPPPPPGGPPGALPPPWGHPFGGMPGRPPLGWMGSAPPPWGPPPAGFGPPGPHQRPPPWGWRGPRPPDPYQRGPPFGPGPFGGPSPHGRRAQPRLEANELGGASLVAERVPPSVNNMDILNDYFLHFGPVTAMQINHNRHEAIITFSRVEHAEEAMKWPVLNDPSIGLRPWRCKAGQKGPHEAPDVEGQASQAPPVPLTDENDKDTGPPPGGNDASPGSEAVPGGSAAAPVGAPAPAAAGAAPAAAAVAEKEGGGAPGAATVFETTPQPGNKLLEFGKALETKRKHAEVEDRRKILLQSLTDQLKKVMAKISSPETTEKNREQLQVILASIKDKITALTPKREQPKPPPPRLRVAPPNATDWDDEDGGQQAPPVGPPEVRPPRPPARWSSWRPPRAPAWSNTWQNEWTAPAPPREATGEERAEPSQGDAQVPAAAAATAAALAGEREDDGDQSCGETEAMESDIEDLEVLAAMAAAAANSEENRTADAAAENVARDALAEGVASEGAAGTAATDTVADAAEASAAAAAATAGTAAEREGSPEAAVVRRKEGRDEGEGAEAPEARSGADLAAALAAAGALDGADD